MIRNGKNFGVQSIYLDIDLANSKFLVIPDSWVLPRYVCLFTELFAETIVESNQIAS